MLRVRGDLIQIIDFAFPPSFVQCHIAIQPLYVPWEFIHYAFGDRLNHFKVHKPALWGMDEMNIENDIHDITHLIDTNVLPWFSEVSTPDALIRFILHHQSIRPEQRMLLCDPYIQNMYLCFSYLYVGDYQKARGYLAAIIEEAQKRYDFLVPIREKLGKPNDMEFLPVFRTLSSLLACNQYDEIQKELLSYIKTTRENCGIDF
jgi:hypothetical protein